MVRVLFVKMSSRRRLTHAGSGWIRELKETD